MTDVDFKVRLEKNKFIQCSLCGARPAVIIKVKLASYYPASHSERIQGMFCEAHLKELVAQIQVELKSKIPHFGMTRDRA